MVQYLDMTVELTELDFDDNNMIWWTVDSVFVNAKLLEKHFENSIFYFEENLRRISQDCIIVLQNKTIEEIESALLTLKDYRVLVISKIHLETFKSICLTQYLSWYSIKWVNSIKLLDSFVYYIESEYFVNSKMTWYPGHAIFSTFQDIMNQSDSFRYLVDSNRYLNMFVKHNEMYQTIYDKKLLAMHWKELMGLESFQSHCSTNDVKLAKSTELKFTKFFTTTIKQQKINFDCFMRAVAEVSQVLHGMTIDAHFRFKFYSYCTNIEQLMAIENEFKKNDLQKELETVVQCLHDLYNLPFHELFIINNKDILKVLHCNMLSELQKDFHTSPQFATQFDRSDYSDLLHELFHTLKEMPEDANLFDTMTALCMKCNLKSTPETRLQFEMLVRDMECMGIVSLNSKRDHMRKNLMFFT